MHFVCPYRDIIDRNANFYRGNPKKNTLWLKNENAGLWQKLWRKTRWWVNCVRRWWNAKNPDETISQYAVNIHSEEFDELIQKWHRVNIGLKGNSKYNLDISDGVLDSTNIGKTTYGHSTTIRKLNNAIFKWTYVIDNYCWEMKHNIYGFKDFQSFIDSGLVYETAYVFWKINLILI